MLRRFFFCALLFPALSALGDTPRPKSGIPAIDSLPLNDWKADTTPLSTSKALTLAVLLPGGGQFYGGHPVRGSFLVGLETVLFGLSLYSYYVDLPRYDRETNRLLDSANAAFDHVNSDANAQSRFEGWTALARDNAAKRLQQADLANSELAWAIGLHFYGIADAFEIARRSQSEPKVRSVKRAMWYGLAFPGGGQLYNGRYGKFGLLWMGIGGSVVSTWSRQNVVESLNRSVAAARTENASNLDELERDRTVYRKRRNQYYWGMAIFYVYAVMDGMVDAALSDFDKPNRYAFGPGPTPLSFETYIHF